MDSVFRMHKEIKAPQNLTVTVGLFTWLIIIIAIRLLKSSCKQHNGIYFIRYQISTLGFPPNTQHKSRNNIDKDNSILVLDDNVCSSLSLFFRLANAGHIHTPACSRARISKESVDHSGGLSKQVEGLQ